MSELRADWKIARAISRSMGLSAARKWMETPFIDVSNMRDEVTTLQHMSAPGTMRGSFSHMPYCPLIVKLGPWVSMIVRYTDNDFQNGATHEGLRQIQDGLPMMGVQDPNSVFVIEAFSLDDSGEVSRSDVSVVVNNENFKSIVPRQPQADIPRLTAEASWIARNMGAAVRLINNCGKHVIRIDPAPSQADRILKTGIRKPWLRRDVPSVILIDLAEAHKYGHRVDHGGTHASPHPHTRRGHYATLRSPRFKNKVGQRVWVKQAWVGDREWIFEGRQYRVLNSEAEAK